MNLGRVYPPIEGQRYNLQPGAVGCSSSSSDSESIDYKGLCADCRCNGPRGPRGPCGDQGPTGPQGRPGSNGTDGTDGQLGGGCAFYGNIDIYGDNPDYGPFAPVYLNFTEGSGSWGSCLTWDVNGVTVVEDGTYAFYYQYMPVYPAKIVVTLNGTNGVPGSMFGMDQDPTLGTNGYANAYYAGQVIASIPANTYVQFFFLGNQYTQLDSSMAAVTMIRLSQNLVTLP